MRCASVLAVASFSFSLLNGQEPGFGFDEVDEKAPVVVPEKKREMDEILRPEVFARYERLPDLDRVGTKFYRAHYRIPASVYSNSYPADGMPDVQEWLEKEGVEFGEGASVVFGAETRILEVVQTIHQLTKVELLLARFGGTHDVFIRLEVFEFPLMEGWELVNSASGLFDQSSIRESALNLVKKGEGKIIDTLAAKIKSGERGKISRSPISEEQSNESFQGDVFEFDAISGPTGISGGTDPRIQVNFIFKRSEGSFAPRTVMSVVSFPSQGSVVASSWREGDMLQILFLGGEIRTVNGVMRVRKVSGE